MRPDSHPNPEERHPQLVPIDQGVPNIFLDHVLVNQINIIEERHPQLVPIDQGRPNIFEGPILVNQTNRAQSIGEMIEILRGVRIDQHAERRRTDDFFADLFQLDLAVEDRLRLRSACRGFHLPDANEEEILDYLNEQGLLCAISHQIPEIPVKVGATVFDYTHLVTWVSEWGNNPLTREPLSLDEVVKLADETVSSVSRDIVQAVREVVPPMKLGLS